MTDEPLISGVHVALPADFRFRRRTGRGVGGGGAHPDRARPAARAPAAASTIGIDLMTLWRFRRFGLIMSFLLGECPAVTTLHIPETDYKMSRLLCACARQLMTLGLLARRHTRGRPRQRTGNTSLVITAPWRAGVAVTTAACLGLSLLPFIAQLAVAAGSVANVDGARIAAADRDPANRMTYGRTYSEQRFSPYPRSRPTM